MANFEPIIQWLLYIEDDHRAPGKIVNLGDGNGLTRLGLTQRFHEKDVPDSFFTALPFKDAVAAAKIVYRNQYWNSINGDKIPYDEIAALVMSFAVNRNAHIAAWTLQGVLETTQDGVIGPATIVLLSQKDSPAIARSYRAAWIQFYQHIVDMYPKKQIFLEGWINRANFPYPSSLVPNIYG